MAQGEEAQAAMPVAEVKAASRDMLQRQLYVVRTRPVAGLGPVLANLEAHLDFQVELERSGILFAAGPIWTEDEERWCGEGMVVLRAESRAAAIAIAERDPMHRAGARAFTVTPWMINEGRLAITLNLSTQRFEVV